MMNGRSVVTALLVLVCSFQGDWAQAQENCEASYEACTLKYVEAFNSWNDVLAAKSEKCLAGCASWVPSFQWVCEGFCDAKAGDMSDRVLKRFESAMARCAKKKEICDSKSCKERGESFNEEVGACCPDNVPMPGCAPCPRGWDGGINELVDSSGCLIGYDCYCNEPVAVDECQSDADCLAGEVCTAETECLSCASCPLCDVCCGACVPADVSCTENDCGPKPGLPSQLCDDGVTVSGPGACELQEGGACGWTIVECPVLATCEHGGEQYLEGEGFPGLGTNWCNSCFCGADGSVNCTKMGCSSQCDANKDCDEGHWCRPVCDEEDFNICVPYVGEGESCGGYVPECFLEICDEGLECVDDNPFVADLPGTCQEPCEEVQCFVDPCEVASCPAHPDAQCVSNYCGGCNATFYVDGFPVSCDEPVSCEYGGQEYAVGDSFDGVGDNWCNDCNCGPDGAVACTKMLCGPQPCEENEDCDAPPAGCEENGVSYAVGESFSGTGGNWCNTCACMEGGLIACTLMACGPNPCVVSGCSSQICASQSMNSTCEWLPEYACYQSVGSCGPFGKNGACAWDDTNALNQCLDDAGNNPPLEK